MGIAPEAMEILMAYSWPGNVRELENVVQRLVVMSDAKLIEVPDLPSLMRFSALTETGLRRTLAEVEAEHIRNVLAAVAGNKTRAAEILDIDRKTLREKLKLLKPEAAPEPSSPAASGPIRRGR
jgi:DNA-binding NtrC family response regulator